MGTKIKSSVLTDEMISRLKRWQEKAKRKLAKRSNYLLAQNLLSLNISPSFETSLDVTNLSTDTENDGEIVDDQRQIQQHTEFGSFGGFHLSTSRAAQH